MANQPSWPPFQPQEDCSQPFCTIYCPQWCYSPPPTFDPFDSTPIPFSIPLLTSNSNTGLAFSTANIAIIAIVATIFFFAAYFILLHKCHRRQHHLELPTTIISTVNTIERNPGSTPKGLDQSLINRITTFKFTKGAPGIIKGTSCSICIGEFCEGEILRILPKCSHMFHMRCVDTWLRSRLSCPLCRAGIVWAGPVGAGPPPLVMARESEGGQSMEVDRQDSLVTNDDYESVLKDPLEGRGMRRSLSVGFLSRRGDSGEDRSAASSSMGGSSERTVLSMRPGSMVRSLSCGR